MNVGDKKPVRVVHIWRRYCWSWYQDELVCVQARWRARTQWVIQRRTSDRRSSRGRSLWCTRRAVETLERRYSLSLLSARSVDRWWRAPDSIRRWSRRTPMTVWQWECSARRPGWRSNRCLAPTQSGFPNTDMHLSCIRQQLPSRISTMIRNIIDRLLATFLTCRDCVMPEDNNMSNRYTGFIVLLLTKINKQRFSVGRYRG